MTSISINQKKALGAIGTFTHIQNISTPGLYLSGGLVSTTTPFDYIDMDTDYSSGLFINGLPVSHVTPFGEIDMDLIG